MNDYEEFGKWLKELNQFKNQHFVSLNFLSEDFVSCLTVITYELFKTVGTENDLAASPMQWRMAALAYGRFGGPDAIHKQLRTEQYPHLPCGEFFTQDGRQIEARVRGRCGSRNIRPTRLADPLGGFMGSAPREANLSDNR